LEVKNTATKPEGVFARYGCTTLQKQLGFQHRVSFTGGVERCLAIWKELKLPA